jgi:LacI family transcriptional regulator
MKTISPKIPKHFHKKKNKHVLLALGWYASAIHQGVAHYARAARWSLDINYCRTISYPKIWKGDGIIAILGSNPSVDAMVQASRLPTVCIGPRSTAKHFPLVTPDNQSIGEKGARYLIDHGFKHFAYYVHSVHEPGETTPRVMAFKKVVAEQGLTFHLICPPAQKSKPLKTHDAFMAWLRREIGSLPKPVAIMSDYDDLATNIIDACEGSGISIPDEVAVLGVGNDGLRCELTQVPLSSIDDDQFGQGYKAAEMLDRLMSGKHLPSKIVEIPPKGIVTRTSSDILKISHIHVATALRIIHEHFQEPINVAYITRAVPMSYRSLHDAFLKQMGRTLGDEIEKVRMDHACRLLDDSSRKIEDVAFSSGFGSAERMRKTFLRNMKIAPRDYQKQQAEHAQKPRIKNNN